MNKQLQESRIKTDSAFIFHGVWGYPEENWFPWLGKELSKKSINVYIPQFPTPEDQTLDNWFRVFQDYSDYFNENSILIGHSLGTVFILNLLQKINFKIKGAFLVAPFQDFLNHKEIDPLIVTFIHKNFNWKKIKSNCEQIFLYYSDDDPYIPLEQPRTVATNLGTQNLKVFHQAGHFNSPAGYSNFPELLNDISSVLDY